MKFKLKYIFLFFFLVSCVENIKLINKDNTLKRKPFSSKGFALIYNENLFKEKIIKKK